VYDGIVHSHKKKNRNGTPKYRREDNIKMDMRSVIRCAVC